MFIHDSHLPQVLTPRQYTSEEQYQRELETIFLPAWHIVGTLPDLPQDGDFFTFELLGHPLIVWNAGGRIHTFLNACPNRFSRLSNEDRGHAGPKLKCRYDGWEFDSTGRAIHVPGVAAANGSNGEQPSLRKFPTEVCGQLIFVNLSDDPAGLREFLGNGYELAETLCSKQLLYNFTLDIEIDANWKTKIENSLESYHIEMIHSKTFRTASTAEDSYHALHPGWTSYETPDEAPTRFLQLLDRIMDRLVSVEIEKAYKHYVYYPHLMFGKMRLFSWAEMIIPISATRARIRTYYFCYRGQNRLRSTVLVKFLRAWQWSFFTKVSYEDASILPEVQRGLEAPIQPSTGVISIREERCFHFQEFIKQATGADSAVDAAVNI